MYCSDLMDIYLKRIYGNKIHANKARQYKNSNIKCIIPKDQFGVLDIIICHNDKYSFVFNNMIRKDYSAYTKCNSISGIR